jgi:maleate isomerase
MDFSAWRGTLGIVRPTFRPGGMEELIKMMPDGIGVIPLFADIREGTEKEFRSVLDRYETNVAKLAEVGCDVANPAGAPPFMVHGYKGEQKIIKSWEKKYKIPIFTSGSTHVDALRALKVKRFIGFSYFRGDINKIYAQYFKDAGFDVLDMVGLDADFQKVQEFSSHQIYRWIKANFLKHKGAQAIYMLGPAWRTLDIIEPLENDCGVPVVHAVPAQCWDTQRHLNVRQPVYGFGRLLADML